MKKKETAGLIDVPGPNDLRPHAKNVKPSYAQQREALKFAQGTQMVHDYGAPDGDWYGSLSPASGTFTAPLPGKPAVESKDPLPGTQKPLPRSQP